MNILMLSSDRKILDSDSSVSARMQEYAALGNLTIIVAGKGVPGEVKRDGYRLIYPGGSSKIENFLRIVYTSRILEADILTAQDPFYLGLAAVCSGKRPLQIQLHTDQWGVVAKILSRITLPRATCVRVVSEHVADKIRHLTRAPISVLPVFVDPAPYTQEYERPAEFGNHPVVVTASRLAPEKRLPLVIAALKGVPDAHLYLLGDGGERGKLEALVQTLGLTERVHFLGWKNDIAPYLMHADCFVQASAFEGYGMSLVSAVLAGTAVVSTNVGVARDLPKEIVTIVTASEYDIGEAIKTSLSKGSRVSRREVRETFLRSLPSKAEYLKRYKELLTTC